MFQGHYLNGVRHGKGIEYDSKGKKIFEGEYINDKRWNGIEYIYKGKTLFEVQYINGDKNGKIIMKQYFKKNLIYEGESLNEKRNGKGKEYFKNELIYEGEYLNGKRHGKGIEYNIEKGKFVGEFRNGKKWDGIGFDINDQIEYSINNGNGMIKEYYEGRLVYEGEYENGERHGYGTEYNFLTKDIIYIGRFAFGKKFEKENN